MKLGNSNGAASLIGDGNGSAARRAVVPTNADRFAEDLMAAVADTCGQTA